MFSVDPYLARTYDPQRYHCWHLLIEAWRDLTGDDLDLSLTGRNGPLLQRVSGPVNPCVVLLCRDGNVPHAGLFRNGRVLHIDKMGARFERLETATRGFGEIRYYAKRNPDHGPDGTGGRVGNR